MLVRATEISPLNLQEIDTGTAQMSSYGAFQAPAGPPQAGGAGTLPPGLQPHATAPPAGGAAGTGVPVIANPGSPNPGSANPNSGMARPKHHCVPTSTAWGCRLLPPQTVAQGRRYLPGGGQAKRGAGRILRAHAVALRQQQAGADQCSIRAIFLATMARPLRSFIAMTGGQCRDLSFASTWSCRRQRGGNGLRLDFPGERSG